MLRRTRKEVLKQLPARTDKNLFVGITDEQRAVHDDYYEIVCRIVNRWKKMGFLKEEDRQRLLISLNIMRMVCNSTYIIDQETNHQTKLDELFDILEEVIAAGEEKIVIQAKDIFEKAYSGLAIFEPSVLDLIPFTGKFSLIDVYLGLAPKNKIAGFDHSGEKLIDVGRPESLPLAEKMFA